MQSLAVTMPWRARQTLLPASTAATPSALTRGGRQTSRTLLSRIRSESESFALLALACVVTATQQLRRRVRSTSSSPAHLSCSPSVQRGLWAAAVLAPGATQAALATEDARRELLSQLYVYGKKRV